MSTNINASATHRFNAPPDRVYDAWLETDSVRMWMKAALQDMGLSGDVVQVEIDPRVGGSFIFSDLRDGTETKHWGKYLELSRPRKIAFTWILDESDELDPSQVAMTFQPDGEGCMATIVHQMDVKWADYVVQTQHGWSCMMQALDKFLDSQP